MSYNNYNIDIIDLQDKSLTINDVKHEVLDGVKSIILNVSKDRKDSEKCCKDCGSINIKINSYHTRKIKFLDIAGHNSL